tara:strand:- start:1728 stop:1847 length:120 start_codon:yes stop_codon:yes gene_type:complete
MKDKLIMTKELHFVYIVNGKKFLDEEEAKKYLEEVNNDR